MISKQIGVLLGGLTLLGLIFAAAGSVPKSGTILTYQTTLQGRTRDQRHNAQQSLAKLKGATIQPGHTLSFNERVGTWSRDEGYRKAPISYNGQLISSWGGGVCQTSTTLYNAALIAGLDIVERHPHRFAPGYIVPGRDAAVAFWNIDLKIRNPYDFPIRIDGEIEKNSLKVSIVGIGGSADLSEIITEPLTITKPSTYLIAMQGDIRRLRNSGKPGVRVTTYRIRNGKKERLSTDNYPVMHRIEEFR